MKRVIALFLTISFVCICTITGFASAPVFPVYGAEYTSGDVNGDAAIDAHDALLVLQYAVDKISLSERAINSADVSYDNVNKQPSCGIVDATDALLILQRAVRIIRSFPCVMVGPG